MNRILRGTALSIASGSCAVLPVLMPAAASAEPLVWQRPLHMAGDSEVNHNTVTPKSQIEYEERLAADDQV
ncbi:MAG: hypothetical protein ABI720_08955, partial [Actinomycetes bacterium]